MTKTIKIQIGNEVFEREVPDDYGVHVVKSASTNPRDYDLSPRKFNRFMVLHRYDDVAKSIMAALKASGDMEALAAMSGDLYGAKTFKFGNVLAVLGGEAVSALIPEGIDVSEETLSEHWLEASAF